MTEERMISETLNEYGFREILPAFEENNIPIVFATDNNYVPFLAVAIESLIENCSQTNNYDIIILASKVSNEYKHRLARMANKADNISIRWYNISDAVKNYKFANCSYYTDAIYYRIFMPYIMSAYKKMVYLDCDLIAVDDIASLYNVELGDKYLGAVKDIGMIIYKYNSSELQYLPKNYFKQVLSSINIEEYFNSGVLVMNLEAFRKDFSLDQLIAETNKDYLLYPDQDGLNIIVGDNKVLLDMGWNTFPYNMGTRSKDYIERYLPEDVLNEYMESRKKPHIIHYNMLEKPWLHPCWLDHDLMVQFWFYAKNCSFFGDLVWLKPTEFYKSKHKATIPYFERQAVVELVGKGAQGFKQTKNDILFCAGRFVVANLSDVTVKYETLDLDGKSVYLNASILLGLRDREKIAWFSFFDKKGRRYACNIQPKGKPYLFGDTPIGQEYILSAEIPLRNQDLELKLCAMYDGMLVQMKRFNFSRNFPIDRINPAQYYFDKNYIVTYRGKNLCFTKATLKKRLKYELKFEKSLRRQHKRKTTIASLLRIPAMIVKKMRRRPVWIVGCNFAASDNGFAFFRYLQTKKKEVNAYFAVNDINGEVAEKVKSVGQVVDKHSRKFQWLMLTSNVSISSVADLRLIRPFSNNDQFRDILARRKFVFLQHGIISQDLSKEHNRFVYNPAMFCTSTNQEYESVVNGDYFYNGQVKLTGLPRFDYLYHDEKKIITIMPTWRKYYNGDYGKNTRFYQFYYALLHDEKLQKALKEYGYTLQFKPHPIVCQKTNLSIYKRNDKDDAFTFADKSYAETYAESNLVLTDYSSAVFDFLYLRKPIIYTQFDADEFFSGKHVYERGYINYETNGFGEVEYTVEGTVERIIEYMRNDCQLNSLYKERIESFFCYNDKNNCERVYEEIRKISE